MLHNTLDERAVLSCGPNPYAIRGVEIGRPLSRPIEDQQLVLDEQGLGHHGTRATGTDEPDDCRQQMQKQDGEIAHRTILARSRHAQDILTNFGIRHAQAVLDGDACPAGSWTGYRIEPKSLSKTKV